MKWIACRCRIRVNSKVASWPKLEYTEFQVFKEMRESSVYMEVFLYQSDPLYDTNNECVWERANHRVRRPSTDDRHFYTRSKK